MSKITYANKVALNENSDIADINKVKADDMNEIKSCVNNNDDMLTGGAVAGNMVVDSIRTKNLLDINLLLIKNDYTKTISYSGSSWECRPFQLKANTTYTLSLKINSWTVSGSWFYGIFNGDESFITMLQNQSVTSDKTQTFTTGSNGLVYFGTVYGFSDDRLPLWAHIVNIQIEEGSTATTYNSYQPLSLNNQTIYAGALQGTQTTTLSNVKRFLKVFMRYTKTGAAQNIIYELDTSSNYNLIYGSGIGIASDESGGLDYYVSESSYNKTSGVFTHTRTGYFKLPNTFTARNSNNAYIIYRIDTYD